MMTVRGMVAVVLIGLGLSPAAVAADGTMDDAPFRAGFHETTYGDPLRGGRAGLVLWYPTGADERLLRRGPFIQDVAEGADPAPGRFPLVMISHGSGGNALGHRGMARFLARQGFVVAAVVHSGNTTGDDGTARTAAMWRARPVQFSAAVDAVLADPLAGPAIDPERIGAFGFSAGGYTVLAAVSGRADLARIGGYCNSVPEDWGFCGGTPQTLAVGEGEEGVIRHPPDTRIRAAVLAAPVGALFGPEDLAAVRIPVRLYRAERDAEVGSAQVEAIRALLPVPPEYAVVERAGHFAFMSPFPAFVAAEVGPPAEDPPGFDRPEFLARLNQEVAAFFRRTLMN